MVLLNVSTSLANENLVSEFDQDLEDLEDLTNEAKCSPTDLESDESLSTFGAIAKMSISLIISLFTIMKSN